MTAKKNFKGELELPSQLEESMACFWPYFVDKYQTTKIINPACAQCIGMDEKCPYYMPLTEMKEYLCKN